MEKPQTLLEAIRLYKDPEVAEAAFTKMRWPHGVVACPRLGCGSASVARLEKYRRWYCNDCKRQFSAKTNTIFEDSPIGFDKWLPAMWLLSSDRNGISSCELARALGVGQKAAWFMLHRIRLAMQEDGIEPLSGEIEADETYIGGKFRGPAAFNPITGRRKAAGPAKNKQTVLAMIQRGGKVKAFVVPNSRRISLLPVIREHVKRGSTVYTDSLRSYHDLKFEYDHQTINHAIEYVRGHVTTNRIESFFSVLKRTLRGTYVAPRPQHLQRYLDEQIFRFNARRDNDGPRFEAAVKGVEGKRIMYKELIAK